MMRSSIEFLILAAAKRSGRTSGVQRVYFSTDIGTKVPADSVSFGVVLVLTREGGKTYISGKYRMEVRRSCC